MENNKHKIIILEAIKESEYGLSLSDMKRQLPLSRCQIRTQVAILLGAEKIEEVIYGRSKVYFLT